MASLAITGILLALAIYIPELMFFGGAIFTDASVSDGGACSGFFECLFEDIGSLFDIIGSLFQFLTLTGLPADVDGNVLIVARFALGLVWTLIIIGFIRGSNQS